jgi:hypothetical protein
LSTGATRSKSNASRLFEEDDENVPSDGNPDSDDDWCPPGNVDFSDGGEDDGERLWSQMIIHVKSNEISN